jgi:hypothetical protein
MSLVLIIAVYVLCCLGLFALFHNFHSMIIAYILINMFIFFIKKLGMSKAEMMSN